MPLAYKRLHVAEAFPNLVCVAEDPLHLVFRADASSGGHRTAMGFFLLRAQMKFAKRTHSADPYYVGQRVSKPFGPMGAWHSPSPLVISHVMEKLEKGHPYLQTPFASHAEYVECLACIVEHFPLLAQRKDGDGRTAAQIVRSGAAYSHFAYLQNGSKALGLLSESSQALAPAGTTVNEAFHREIAVRLKSIHKQHRDKFLVSLASCELYKLLTHHSAYFRQTTTQRTARSIASDVAGSLMHGFITPPTSDSPAGKEQKQKHATEKPSAHHGLRTSNHEVPQATQASRKKRQRENNEMAQAEHAIKAPADRAAPHGPHKRTVFTDPRAKPKRRKQGANALEQASRH